MGSIGGRREVEGEKGASRCAGSGLSASDRPAAPASGRVTRGLGIVAHRWSISFRNRLVLIALV